MNGGSLCRRSRGLRRERADIDHPRLFEQTGRSRVGKPLAGQFEEARALHYELLDLMKVNFIESNPGPVKAALAMRGIIKEHYRLPLVPVRAESKRKIREVLEHLAGVLEEA